MTTHQYYITVLADALDKIRFGYERFEHIKSLDWLKRWTLDSLKVIEGQLNGKCSLTAPVTSVRTCTEEMIVLRCSNHLKVAFSPMQSTTSYSNPWRRQSFFGSVTSQLLILPCGYILIIGVSKFIRGGSTGVVTCNHSCTRWNTSTKKLLAKKLIQIKHFFDMIRT